MCAEKQFTPDFEAAKNAAERLVKLFSNPEPGLGTWHWFVGLALSGLDTALFPIDQLRLESASPDLLEACKEFVRKCENSQAKSKRSYEQMKAAIAKAEGK